MTEGEVASLVLSTLAHDEPDGTYVFKVSEPVKIIRLAHASSPRSGVRQNPDCPLEPGEARDERLFVDDENPSKTSVPEV